MGRNLNGLSTFAFSFLSRVLLLGRFSSALGELSANLHKCMAGGLGKSETTVR